LSRKDELTLTQKLAKEAERTRLVFSLEVILAPVETKVLDNFKVIKEVLQANRIALDFKLERTKAREGTSP
jgi:hypothetical protein